jgi:fibro-slime domain-containing protein
MKQQRNKSKIFGGVALGLLILGVVTVVLGLSSTVGEIAEKTISKTPDAILASAGVSEEKLVSLPVMYYDQKSDECVNLYDNSAREALSLRQFEWTECRYYNKEIEQGLVEFELGEDYLPVATGKGDLLPNKGVDFKRWFGAVDGKSESYVGNLKMQYVANGAEFIFKSDKFYPLDAAEFSNGDTVNKDGHNHLFTMNFAVPFTVLSSGEEEFEITADDDTFVFVGNKLVIDMGGIHGAATAHFTIYKSGEIYAAVDSEDFAYSGVNVAAGDGSIVRIFHADRDSDSSVFNVKVSGMNLGVKDVKLADGGDEDGVQIAYDPTDPTYVAPLGETSVVRPDSTKGLIVMATIEGVMIVVVSVLLVSVARFLTRQKK